MTHKSWHKVPNLFQIPSECTIYRPCFHCFFCSSKSFQIPPQCTIYHPCFQNISAVTMRSLAGFRNIVFKGFLQFQIFSNTVRMHSLETLFKKNCIVFKMFYAVPNRLKFRHFSKWFKRHCFRVFSLQFQIVSNTIRMHALKTLVSNKILHFPIC